MKFLSLSHGVSIGIHMTSFFVGVEMTLKEIFKFSKYFWACFMLWSVNCNLVNANTMIQCYADYMERYSMFDGSYWERVLYNNKPIIRLTISGDRVISYTNYHICSYGVKLEPSGFLHGWVDTVTSSTTSLSCVEIKWEPEKRSGIKETINIDRYTGKMFIEEFGYSINNDKMAYPFTISEKYGHCEVAKQKF